MRESSKPMTRPPRLRRKLPARTEIMAKDKRGIKVRATDRHGAVEQLRAECLELEFETGRRLTIRLCGGNEPALEIVADEEGGAPVLSVSSIADNAIRVALLSVEPALALPAAMPTPMLQLRVQKALSEDERGVAPRKHRIRRWARAALLEHDADVTIRLVGETEGRALNRDYRGKDHATNVLTFSYRDGEAPVAQRQGLLQGDLALCVPVVVREAGDQGKELDAHFAHLVVHGMLHLQGYDHERPDEAEAMEALEVDILQTLGYGNPYEAKREP
ncbi:rRNA maturation RNase YbeY [Rhodocyclaceae bacterium SMB388]